MAGVRAVDLFGGPGGWDVAAQALGIQVVGLEFDADACATRRANGLPTIRCDVSRYQFPLSNLEVDGLIASPPCPQFSNAGLGRGRLLTRELQTAIKDQFHGHERRDLHTKRCADILIPGIIDQMMDVDGFADEDAFHAVANEAAAEAMLMVEPARYIARLQPRWVVMEQVPAVLPLFDTYRAQLEALGYWCWVGKLKAEQFGVPQTRTRAVLMASNRAPIHPPTPTHQEYVPGEAAGEGADCRPSLFGPGVAPWISMAEALGWVGDSLVGFPRKGDDRGPVTDDGYRERDLRPDSEPSFAVTEKARSWVVDTGQNSEFGGGRTKRYVRSIDAPSPAATSQTRSWRLEDRQDNGAERDITEPAPTILASHDNGNKRFVLNTRRDQRPDGSTQTRPGEEPAPTLTAAAGDGQWIFERPATTVMGDPRVWPPGHKINAEDIAAGRTGIQRGSGLEWPHRRPSSTIVGSNPGAINPEGGGKDIPSSARGYVRLTVDHALVLQSFPFDFQVTGTVTSQFKQCGNAIPPLLAWHILRAVLGE